MERKENISLSKHELYIMHCRAVLAVLWEVVICCLYFLMIVWFQKLSD